MVNVVFKGIGRKDICTIEQEILRKWVKEVSKEEILSRVSNRRIF